MNEESVRFLPPRHLCLTKTPFEGKLLTSPPSGPHAGLHVCAVLFAGSPSRLPGTVREIALQNLALRQQLTVFKRHCLRPPTRKGRSSLLGSALQDLEGLAAWVDHRKARDRGVLASEAVPALLDLGLQRKRRGRPEASPEIRAFIRKMAAA